MRPTEQPRNFGPQMVFFGRIASLVMDIAAFLGIFAEIPIISDYAFWLLVGAYLLWLAVHKNKHRFNWQLMLSIVLTLVAIVGVFVEITTVSNYAFWIMAAAYLIVFGITAS
jgi:hypothetical protein